MTSTLAKALSALKLAHPAMLGSATELAVTRSGHFEVLIGATWHLICTSGTLMRLPIMGALYRKNGKKVHGLVDAVVVMHVPKPLCANGGSVTLGCRDLRIEERTLVAVLPVFQPFADDGEENKAL